MNIVLSRKVAATIITGFVILVASGSANAQVIGGSSGTSGLLGSGSDSSAFQQTQSQDQSATNSAQQAAPGDLLLTEATGALKVIGSSTGSVNTTAAVSSESPSTALIVTLLALSALALYGVYRLNKDDWFSASAKADAMADEPILVAETKKPKKSAKAAKTKKNKKHHR